MTTTLGDTPRHLRARRLAHLVADAAHASTAHGAEHYDPTAILVDRPAATCGSQTVVVELIHTHDHAEHRWTALAIDDPATYRLRSATAAPPGRRSPGIAWTALDS